MPVFLDTQEYMQARKAAIELSLLLRAYYDGLPYVQDPLDVGANNWQLWQRFLRPTDPDGSEPTYLDNVPRNIIDTTVSDVLPDGTRLAVDGLEEEEREDLLTKLLNFGPGYSSGEDGLLDWCNSILTDSAQTGDGLLVPTYSGERQLVRMNFYASEIWDAERDASAGDEEVLFYRIEYKYKQADGKEYWRRVDIHTAEIVRYEDKAGYSTLLHDGKVPPSTSPLALSWMGGFTAGRMSVRERTPLVLAESAELAKLGDFIAVPIIWRRNAFGGFRGQPEVPFSMLPSVDDIQRLLTRWKDSAINVGDPPLGLIDISEASDPTGDPNKKLPADVGPGSMTYFQSLDDKHGRMAYPENTPTVLPHEQVLERVRQAAFGNTPNMGLDPGRVSRFGELTGFANKLMRGNYDQKITQLRRRVLTNGILRALLVGARILALKGLFPEEKLKKLKFRFEFGGPLYSPDEKLKIVTGLAMQARLGVPPKDLAAQMPFDPADWDELVAGIEKSVEQSNLLAEMKQALTGAASGPGGVDKRGLSGGAGSGPKPGASSSPAGPAGP